MFVHEITVNFSQILHKGISLNLPVTSLRFGNISGHSLTHSHVFSQLRIVTNAGQHINLSHFFNF